MPAPDRIYLGKSGENAACDELRRRGYAILARGYRTRMGEIDIIARDGPTLVFVEVKARTSDRYGGVAYAVTPQKVRRLRRLAGLWLAAQAGRFSAVRIDVIGVRFGRTRQPELTHVQAVG